MSSCTPTAPERRTKPPGASPPRGNDNWVPRTRDQEQYVITRVLYRPVVVTVTPGSGCLVVMFAALCAGGARRRRVLTPVDRPDHANFGARAVVYRPYLKIVDESGQ